MIPHQKANRACIQSNAWQRNNQSLEVLISGEEGNTYSFTCNYFLEKCIFRCFRKIGGASQFLMLSGITIIEDSCHLRLIIFELISFSFLLRSSIGGLAYVTVFNSSATWATTFRLREYKCMLVIFVFP